MIFKDMVRSFIYNHKWRKSFSQTGEDCIVSFIFEVLGIKKPSYIDIGAHHPYFLSNTAMFYAKGSQGINIEPDPLLFRRINRVRKRDINLQIGLSNYVGTLPFFVMDARTLSTFSEDEAQKYVREHGHKIKEIIQVKADTLFHVIEKYSNGKSPDFMTLDAEGIDEIIVGDLKIMSSLPKVLCVETIEYAKTGIQVKNKTIIEMLLPLGYMLFADTYINSIFVLQDVWEKR